jgi:F-type H+-transporting ATPase subunit b
MNLDYTILVTQVIGFLIVLAVLRKFAWGPILGILEERRARVANEIHSAEQLRKQADALKLQYENELKTIEAQARERIQQAIAEGQKVSEEKIAAAREDAQRIREKANADIQIEYDKARATLHDDIVRLSLGISERLMHEQMDSERNRKLVDRFLTEAKEMKTS